MRTWQTGVTSSAKVRIGLIFRVVPIAARAAPIRPPRRRYSSVSSENQIPPLSRASSLCRTTSSGLAPPLAAVIAASRTIPVPPAALRLSTVRMRSPPLPSRVSRSIACFAESSVPEIPAEMCTETISRPASSSGS